MWPRKTLDIGFFDIFRGLSYVFRTRDETGAENASSIISGRFVCLSVRSGFDTLLRSLQFPPNSEILFSELTIPDMARIAAANSLKPIGVGLDAERWSVDPMLLERAITPKTRAIVVAHLFGRRDSLGEVVEIARRHRLILIEDCAQSFHGPEDTGDPRADVSMFSFGPIKTNTCLAGAVLHVRTPRLAETFSRLHGELPRQSNRSYAKRLTKFLVLKNLNRPIVYGLLYRLLILFGCDPDLTISGLARGFAGKDFLGRIRKRPSSSLVRLIEKRLKTYQPRQLERRALLGRELTSLLSPSIRCPASSRDDTNKHDGFWVFPVLSHHPESLKTELVQQGFDGTQRSSLAVIANRCGGLTVGQEFLERVVFLPLEIQMSDNDIKRLADTVNSHEQRCAQEGSEVNQSEFHVVGE